MTAVIWEIAAHIDRNRITSKDNEAIWLEMRSQELRGEGGRHDNVWLRECLDRLIGIKMSGEHRGDPWGAVLLAEWHITDGGSTVKLLVPPAGILALHSPSTFTKIEAHAAHRLAGRGRQLYALLSDKKNMNQKWWVFGLDEMRALMGVDGKKSYERFNNFRQRVLDPAVEAINDYGTVSVKMKPQKQGRIVTAVRFDWQWKDPHAAAETVVENDKHSSARRKVQADTNAPPMIEDEEQADPALTWWGKLTNAGREKWADEVGRVLRQDFGGKTITTNRKESDIAKQAFEQFKAT
jgi:hypothetical protein